MALVVGDRVRETCLAPGTGTVTLLGAATGYQAFSVIGNGNTTYYTIADQTGPNWEVGIGTYTSSGTTLSRDTVLASSNGGSKTNFSSGTQDVFVTYPSEQSVYVSGSSIVPSTAATLPIVSGGTGSSTATFSGANITSLNASNISAGTIGNSYTTASSSNGANTIVSRDANGDFSARIITATTFSGALSGSGAAATSLNGSNVSSGIVGTSYGGTGLTGFTAANNAIYSTSSSALTAGTLPVTAGGTGATVAATALSNLGGVSTGKAIAMAIVFGG